ncbi:endonuclease/exonuclease/phosphatase family protein [Streptomyces sp. AJS327]|uniref:endonuclease/exonuclease/phosphatase family protein n=1 Tax=Streptomyces sp. AJS327 TaxID=2545265 RepID=UPI001C60B67E|nr:endonuclease/exonuclease/phosphatase family protein [Streptomyces sp. AJS327]
MHTGERAERERPGQPGTTPAPRGVGPGHGDGAGAGPRRRRVRRPWLTASAVLLLLVPVGPLVLRALDADGPSPFPQLLAFLPWLLVPGWLALVCAIFARRVLLIVVAVVVLAGTGWFVQPYGPDAPPGAEERPGKARFRVLTANLEYGGATEGLLRALRRERPQLVAVQECDHRCAKALRSAEMRAEYPHRVIATGSRAEGSALLSVFPLSDRSEVPGLLSMPGAVADVRGTAVRVQVAHPMPPETDSLSTWRAELGRLRDYAAERGRTPTLIAGDFNASQDHAAFRALLDTGMRDAARQTGHSRTPTWPTLTAPPLGVQIDHVLLSDPMVPVDAQFVDLPNTDHRALLVDVKLF